MFENSDTIKCPACKQKMEKVYIPSLGLDIDICTDGCGGIFFDENNFNRFYDHTECIDEISNYTDGFYAPANQHLKRQCPECGLDMTKSMVNNNSIEVDVCNNCGGIFLEKEELERFKNNIG